MSIHLYHPGGFHHVDFYDGYNFNIMDYNSLHITFMLVKKRAFEHFFL